MELFPFRGIVLGVMRRFDIPQSLRLPDLNHATAVLYRAADPIVDLRSNTWAGGEGPYAKWLYGAMAALEAAYGSKQKRQAGYGRSRRGSFAHRIEHRPAWEHDLFLWAMRVKPFRRKGRLLHDRPVGWVRINTHLKRTYRARKSARAAQEIVGTFLQAGVSSFYE